MSSNYGKLWASLVSGILIHLFIKWTGLDFASLGVSQEAFRVAIEAGVLSLSVGVPSFFVWLVPNIKHTLHLDVDVTEPDPQHPSTVTVETAEGQDGSDSKTATITVQAKRP